MDKKMPDCPMGIILSLIGGKWKPLVIWHLMRDGTLRFNELSRHIPQVTPKMLTQQLRELEEDGVVIRTVYPVVPPKVEYSLSDFGKSMIPILNAMREWGENYMKNK